MKERVEIVFLLLVILAGILFFSYSYVNITGKAIFDAEQLKIKLEDSGDISSDLPRLLIAGCDSNIGCKNLSFYYYTYFLVFDKEGNFVETSGKPDKISDFRLLCGNIRNHTREDTFSHVSYREDVFTCDLDYNPSNYKGDFISIIAIARDKNDNVIVSNDIIRMIGDRTKLIKFLGKSNPWILSFVSFLIVLILTCFIFWLFNFILNNLRRGEEWES